MLNKTCLTAHSKLVSTREGFGDALVEAGLKEKGFVVLSADLANSTMAEKFGKKFRGRFFEVGIAEQNMAGIAAGLALEGKIPFITSFSSFSPARNWDQIRVSICYTNANVKIFGSHAGFSNGGDGATAQALEDIALLRVLPNMVILHPADALEMKKAVFAAIKHKGPVYIRGMREPTPIITTNESAFKIGEAEVLIEGKDLTLVAAGPVLYQALLAAQEAKKRKGLEIEVINSPSIKPLDEKTILASTKKTGRVLTIEEHQIAGGLGSAVAELLGEKQPTPVYRLGAQDRFGQTGTYAQLLEEYGLSAHCIVKKIYGILEA